MYRHVPTWALNAPARHIDNLNQFNADVTDDTI